MNESEPLQKLAALLGKLPGVGRRSAERMSLRLARDQGTLIRDLTAALTEVGEKVCACSLCGNITMKTRDPCSLCTDGRRDDGLLCVVEDPGDIALIERSGEYRGRYHALMGKLSPMKGEGVAELRVESLIRRVKKDGIREVVLALGSDVESDATVSYLHDVLCKTDAKITRLAFGIPAGSSIGYSDPVTLSRALKGRQSI